MPLLEECILELESTVQTRGWGRDKRTIKTQYTDFYPKFEPEKHWLYKLLAGKYNVVFSERPDYLFFSCFGTQYLKYDCIRIFISNEAVYPNFNLYDYAVTYADFMVTDRLLPNRDAFEYLKKKQIARDREEAGIILKGKTEFCNFVYWGNPDITSLINPEAIINCHDYPDIQSVVEEIRRLDMDDEAYMEKLMQPVLRNENMVKEYLKEREQFICAIIDQPYAKAFRRNRGLRGQWYNDWFCSALGYPNEWFTKEKGYFTV